MNYIISNIKSITINGRALPKSTTKQVSINQQTREFSCNTQAGRLKQIVEPSIVYVGILLQLPCSESRNLLPQFWPNLTSNKIGELFFSGETNLIHAEKVKYEIEWLDPFSNKRVLTFDTSWTKLECEMTNLNLMQIHIRFQASISY